MQMSPDAAGLGLCLRGTREPFWRTDPLLTVRALDPHSDLSDRGRFGSAYPVAEAL